MCVDELLCPPSPEDLILGARSGEGGGRAGIGLLPESAQICSCEGVCKGEIESAIRDRELTEVAQVRACTGAGTGCGGCNPLLTELLDRTLAGLGQEVKRVLCEHFAYTRQELFDIVRVRGIRSFDALLDEYGTGDGCEVCKPAAASVVASVFAEIAVEQNSIQDTNDRFLANLQRGGTYSVVPRVPGGEITPRQLQTIGRVAEKFNLYTKITGGQRIDLFGARVDQLPQIWEELIAAGFESGHAYGKALRTVKSCVGSSWCRFGVQDSVGFAIEVENRYKGIRAPHKLKSAVSGCIRECAEARSKDFGMIATEKGYNLYVCGNGGANPAHGELLAADLDESACIRLIDRFLMFYIRTAPPLTRTSTWLSRLEGGIDYLKTVLVEDSLGICAELEAGMAALVEGYRCEWKAVVESPELRARFSHFVNTPEPDPSLNFVPMRGQKQPSPWSN
jgi:nitrite reductase (NADH) large subunit